MTEDATRAGGEDGFTLEPVILVRVFPDRVDTLMIEQDGKKAFMVFRTAEEATGYQEYTGNHTEEGFEIVAGVDGGAQVIAAALKKTGCGWVALPEPWTGDGAVDFFTAENFLRLLEERTLVES
jgi:hypothetical protein